MENAVCRWITRPSDDKRRCLRDRVEGRTVILLRQIHRVWVWKRSLATGEGSRLPINVCNWYEWAVAHGAVFFLNLDFPPNGRIEFFDFAHGQSTPIFALDKPASIFGGLALYPGWQITLFGQNELDESYIMVMKNFR